MGTSLEQLKKLTQVVADTADFIAMKPYGISEATTNPIIILQAASSSQYKHILQRAVEYGSTTGKSLEEKVENAMDMVIVIFGEEILKVVEHRVHIQLDPRLAFDIERSLTRALKFVNMFAEKGISKEHIVIKLPSTWEGIQAAKILENNHKVHCNMTTMFSLTQAAACADAGVSYLAPFVGRINQWYKEKSKITPRHEGVDALKHIQGYMKKFGYKTKIMGAYFLSADEIKAVAGCDTATIPIELLEELSIKKEDVLSISEDIIDLPMDRMELSEAKFRWLMNENEMASDLLSEMLRVFTAHYIKLEGIIRDSFR